MSYLLINRSLKQAVGTFTGMTPDVFPLLNPLAVCGDPGRDSLTLEVPPDHVILRKCGMEMPYKPKSVSAFRQNSCGNSLLLQGPPADISFQRKCGMDIPCTSNILMSHSQRSWKRQSDSLSHPCLCDLADMCHWGTSLRQLSYGRTFACLPAQRSKMLTLQELLCLSLSRNLPCLSLSRSSDPCPSPSSLDFRPFSFPLSHCHSESMLPERNKMLTMQKLLSLTGTQSC